jgi:hypothetical protein
VSGTFTTPSALVDTNWQIGGTGDFDLDGRADLFWRHRVSGENVVWFMNGTTLTSGTFATPLPGADWAVAGTGDFDEDGRVDLLWHHRGSGENVVWYMNGTVLTGGTFTDPPAVSDTRWQVAAVGDYNADQRPDIVWRHGASGQNVVWLMNGATLFEGVFTNPGVLADVDWQVVGPR